MGEVEQKKERIADLKRQLQEAERAAIISEVATRLHGIEPPAAAEKTRLGPVLTTTVSVEGAPAQAMIDTGSPVTIVDLDFWCRPWPRSVTTNKHHQNR